MGHFAQIGFGTELIYSFVIIVIGLLIYFGTKELYELSSYKGIKYFRQAFLFFSIAYFVRIFVKFFLVFFNVKYLLWFNPMLLNPIIKLLFIYFSAIAVFYLLYSVMWKKWNHDSKILYLFHALAIVMALVILFIGNAYIYLLFNLLLLAFVIYTVYVAYQDSKSKKKGHGLYVIYLLLSIFWILNIIDILIPRFLFGFQLLIYLASIGIFLTILYKVLKKVGG